MVKEETFDEFIENLSLENSQKKYESEGELITKLGEDLLQTQGDDCRITILFKEAKKMGFSEFSLGFHLGAYYKSYVNR